MIKYMDMHTKHNSSDKLPDLDHFHFRHAPFSVAILSKEYITRTTISK